MSSKWKIDPKNPWKDPRSCTKLPSGCNKPICTEVPKHPACNSVEIKKKYQPLIDAANAKLAELNSKLAAEQSCTSIQGQITSTKTALEDCKSKKNACLISKNGGTKKIGYQRKLKGGETPTELLKKFKGELSSLNKQITEVTAKLASLTISCSSDLNSLNSEYTSIKASLEDCNAKKKAACEVQKPIDNGAFNLNTRADLGHVRTGAGRKVSGVYQRGPKKGKLKKGFKYVNGVATKVV